MLEDIEAGDCGCSRGGREEAGQHAHGGGFSGAVGAEEPDDLAFGDGEGDVVDGGGAGVPFCEVFDCDHVGLINRTSVGPESLVIPIRGLMGTVRFFKNQGSC